MFTICMLRTHRGQKRAQKPLTFCEIPYEFWKVNPGSIPKQQVLLTTDQALQSVWDFYQEGLLDFVKGISSVY